MTRRIFSIILVFVLAFTFCSCSLLKDAPIDSDWEFISVTMNGETSGRSDIEDINDAPKFVVLDDGTCVFSLLSKDHPGILEEEDGVYYVSFEEGTRALEITIEHNVMVIEFIPIDCRVVMKAK